MKEIIKLFLKKISRLIYFIYRVLYYLIPKELKLKINKSKLELKLENELLDETYDYFKKHFEKNLIFNDLEKIRKYAIKRSLLNDSNKDNYYLEFGVFYGRSTNFFSQFVNKVYLLQFPT